MINKGGEHVSERATDKEVVPPRQSLGAPACMAIALLAGIIAWAVVVGVDPVFQVTEDFGFFPNGTPPEVAVKILAAQREVDLQNGMLILAVLGLLLGGSLAGCEAWARRRRRPAALAVLGCAAIAAGLGVLGAWLGDLVIAQYGRVDMQSGLYRTIWVQLAMLASLGLGVGLGVGIAGGLPRLFSASFAGLSGGAMAAVIYLVAAAFLLPAAETETIIPDGSVNRLLWIAVSSGLIGLTIGGLRLTQERKPVANAQSQLDGSVH